MKKVRLQLSGVTSYWVPLALTVLLRFSIVLRPQKPSRLPADRCRDTDRDLQADNTGKAIGTRNGFMLPCTNKPLLQLTDWFLKKNIILLASCLFGIVLNTVLLGDDTALPADDAAQKSKDERVVEILIKLNKTDISSQPKYKDAVLRHIATIKGSDRYIELVEKFKIAGLPDVSNELLRVITEKPDSSVGVNAARLLLDAGESALLAKAIESEDEAVAIAAVKAVGSVGNDQSLELVQPLIISKDLSAAIRNQAVRSVGNSRRGQAYLLELVTKKEMPKDLAFSFTNVLAGSRFEEIAKEASKHLTLPETADSTPLPSVAELVQMKGKPELGKGIFATTGTCAKCHKVLGEGKEIGPDLSEIGSKLSREAMFVSILNPSEGISHNFESYFVELESGLSDSGLLVSKTDDEITIKNAEGVLRKFSTQEVLEFEKEEKSMMPDGLQKVLTVQELVSLVDYMQTLTKK